MLKSAVKSLALFLSWIIGAIIARYRILEALWWRMAPRWNIPIRLLAPILVTAGSLLLALLKPHSTAWTWIVGQVLLGLGAGLLFMLPTVPDPSVQPVYDQSEPLEGILPSVIEDYRRSMRYFHLWNEQIVGISIALTHSLVVSELVGLPKGKTEFNIEDILKWGATSPSKITPPAQKIEAIKALSQLICTAFALACFVSYLALILRGLAWLWGKFTRIPWVRSKFGDMNPPYGSYNASSKYKSLWSNEYRLIDDITTTVGDGSAYARQLLSRSRFGYDQFDRESRDTSSDRWNRSDENLELRSWRPDWSFEPSAAAERGW